MTTQDHIDTLTAAITRLEDASQADLAPHAEHLNGIKGRLAILQDAAKAPTPGLPTLEQTDRGAAQRARNAFEAAVQASLLAGPKSHRARQGGGL